MSDSIQKKISPFSVLFRECWIWLPIAILVFFLASILMSGWNAGVLPNIDYPYSFIGDSQGVLNIVKRAIEQPWFFQNWRSGYPFGSNHLDFPSSDTGPIFIIKIIGAFFDGSFVAAYNLYFLLSFSLVFVSTYVVIRAFGINILYACTAGVVYAFASFHFQRLPHYFYISFFFVPIFFYWVLNISGVAAGSVSIDLTRKECIWGGIMLFFSAFFGAYYASFELVCLAFVLIYIYFKWGFGRRFFYCVGAILLVMAGLYVNIAPALHYRSDFGVNPSVAARSMGESEIYGLKVSQMLLPRADHRSTYLSGIATTYIKNFPLVNENHTANLGGIGAIGFLFSFFVIVALSAGRKVDARLALTSALILFLTAFATVGGGAAIFSLLISSQIRGWNRVSIFILFLAIFVFFFVLNQLSDRYFRGSGFKKCSVLTISVLLFIFAMYDQTTSPCLDCNRRDQLVFHKEKRFVEEMEQRLPIGAAVYQLPYLSFPESGGVNKLGDYDLLIPFFLSRDLKFNFGGMRGRPGDDFFAQISTLPINEQVDIVKKLGFSAVYIDRRGYADGAKKIEEKLHALRNVEFVMEDAGDRAVYRILDPSPLVENGTPPDSIYKLVGFKSGMNFVFKEESLGKLPRQIGTFNGDSISTDGRSGFVLFGPYKKLRAGKYKLKVFGTAKDISGAWVDIAGEQGTSRVFQAELMIPTRSDIPVLVDQKFSLKQDILSLEVRVFASASSDFRITGYEISEDR